MGQVRTKLFDLLGNVVVLDCTLLLLSGECPKYFLLLSVRLSHNNDFVQTEEWQEGYRVKHEQSQFGDTIALGDFFADVKLILQSKSSKKKKRHSDKSPPKSSRKLAAVPEGKSNEDHDESVEVVHSDDSNDNGRIEAIEEGEFARTGSSGTGTSESIEDEDRAANPRHYETEYSFSDTSQALGDESDSDEETGRLGRHFEGLSEDERKITRALEKSLGMAADDPDIAEAARRLLDSKILSPEFFQGEFSDDDDDDDNDYKLYGADTKSENDDADSWTDEGEDDNENDSETAPSSIGLILPVDMNVTHNDDGAQDGNEKSPASWLSPSGVNGSNPAYSIKGDDEKRAATPISAITEEKPKVRTESPKQRDATGSKTPIPISSNGDEGEKVTPVVTNARVTGLATEDDTTRGRQSREDSIGGFWAFDSNAATPTRDTGEPLPLPPSNDGTPLLSRRERSASVGPSTPLNPSIFTTVAALAEESDQDDQRRNSFH